PAVVLGPDPGATGFVGCEIDAHHRGRGTPDAAVLLVLDPHAVALERRVDLGVGDRRGRVDGDAHAAGGAVGLDASTAVDVSGFRIHRAAGRALNHDRLGLEVRLRRGGRLVLLIAAANENERGERTEEAHAWKHAAAVVPNHRCSHY